MCLKVGCKELINFFKINTRCNMPNLMPTSYELRFGMYPMQNKYVG
jgi:hypothetical protein